MSFLGIDIGSSAVKAVAYSEVGTALASARAELGQRYASQGRLEIDPDSVIASTWDVLARLASDPALRHHPPSALAASVCGREAFPVDAGGRALGPCIRSADQRGGDLVAEVAKRRSPEEWIAACGHVPERMDPILRLHWWLEHHSETLTAASGFWGWHELLTHRLCGRAVTDPSLASHWLVYELGPGTWSVLRAQELGIDLDLLPDIEPWGSLAGHLTPDVAAQLGLPAGLPVAVGAFDTTAAAVGCGAVAAGVLGLSAGSYEAGVTPVTAPPRANELLQSALALGPHPGSAGLGIFMLSPNGTMALDRARDWFAQPIEDLDTALRARPADPSPVIAIPHLAGAGPPWPRGRDRRGALYRLTLATTGLDIVQGVMEGIACDLALTLDAIRRAGVGIHLIRVTGGGARSSWWMQLKADLTGIPVETVDQREPGAFGVALLAGLATEHYSSLREATGATVRVAHRFEPSPDRGARYTGRLAVHQAAVDSGGAVFG